MAGRPPRRCPNPPCDRGSGHREVPARRRARPDGSTGARSWPRPGLRGCGPACRAVPSSTGFAAPPYVPASIPSTTLWRRELARLLPDLGPSAPAPRDADIGGRRLGSTPSWQRCRRDAHCCSSSTTCSGATTTRWRLGISPRPANARACWSRRHERGGHRRAHVDDVAPRERSYRQLVAVDLGPLDRAARRGWQHRYPVGRTTPTRHNAGGRRPRATRCLWSRPAKMPRPGRAGADADGPRRDQPAARRPVAGAPGSWPRWLRRSAGSSRPRCSNARPGQRGRPRRAARRAVAPRHHPRARPGYDFTHDRLREVLASRSAPPAGAACTATIADALDGHPRRTTSTRQRDASRSTSPAAGRSRRPSTPIGGRRCHASHLSALDDAIATASDERLPLHRELPHGARTRSRAERDLLIGSGSRWSPADGLRGSEPSLAATSERALLSRRARRARRPGGAARPRAACSSVAASTGSIDDRRTAPRLR